MKLRNQQGLVVLPLSDENGYKILILRLSPKTSRILINKNDVNGY